MRPTVFTLLHVAFVIAAGKVAFDLGSKPLGTIGGAISAAFAGVGAFIIGYFCHWVTNRLTAWHYRRKSTTALRAELNEEVTAGTYISCLIIAILLERGESAEIFHEYIVRQRHSDDSCTRRAGLVNLYRCCPEQADSLECVDTFSLSAKDEAKAVAKALGRLPNAPSLLQDQLPDSV